MLLRAREKQIKKRENRSPLLFLFNRSLLHSFGEYPVIIGKAYISDLITVLG